MFKKIMLIAQRFSQDEIITRASSLAYYTALAIAPLLVLFVWGISLMKLDLQQNLIHDVALLAGIDGAKLVESIVQSANKRPDLSSISGWFGLIALMVSASVIFAQLQDTLDVIFSDGRQKKAEKKNESKLQTVKNLIFGRIFSVGMLLSFLFLAIVSLIVSSAISFFSSGQGALIFHALNFVINYAIFTALFTMLFKWLPKTHSDFKSSAIGGAITSLLFIVGKTVIGIYLGKAAVGSAYGAAGSLVVMLAWVFYSATIFFTGAEISAALFIKREKPEGARHGALKPRLTAR